MNFRVVTDAGSHYGVIDSAGDYWPARLAGRFFNRDKTERPIVGDWVEGRLEPGGWVFVEARTARRSVLTRRVAKYETQDLAANVDLLLIACSLNQDFNLNRIDRFLALAHQAGIAAWIVLTKTDLCDERESYLRQAFDRFPQVPTFAVSAASGEGIEEMRAKLAEVTSKGGTVTVLGSSGVGKSTLTNRLLGGETMVTQEIREYDGRGRHTTTHRELLRLPDGGWWMDTPGLRGLRPDFGGGEVAAHVQDLEALILSCRFTDCGHGSEPGCRVRQALESGELSEERWESFWKLKSDEILQERMADPLERRREQSRLQKRIEDAGAQAKFRRRGFK